MEAAEVNAPERPRISSTRTWGFFFLMLGLLVFATLWQGSAPDVEFDVWFALGVIWALLALGWLIYMVARAAAARSFAWITWRDWVLPIAIAITGALIDTNVPFNARFQFAEPAMTRDAQRVIANESIASRTHRIGPWEAESIEVHDGGLRFVIPEIGFLDPVGFAYYPKGTPTDDGEDSYTKLSDGWWVWRDGW